MKGTGRSPRRSLFWSRLLGLLIAFAIIAVLGFGGVKNLMGELSAVYESLAASQSELAVTQHQLDQAQTELDATRQNLTAAHEDLHKMHNQLVAKVHLLRQSEHALKVAGNHIRQLYADREDLQRGLSEAASELAHSNQQLQIQRDAVSAARAQLAQWQQQPKLSMVVTTERFMQTSYRERFAASHVQMLIAGDGSGMFYDGKTIQHEIEQSAVYAERTQMVITQTAPGHDVLECLNDSNARCARVIAAQTSSSLYEAYAYQSMYSSSAAMLVMEDADRRRGRRPGRRR